jgi:type II secretory pathway pseudopilin PulG
MKRVPRLNTRKRPMSGVHSDSTAVSGLRMEKVVADSHVDYSDALNLRPTSQRPPVTPCERGFTLTELTILVFLLAILTLIVTQSILHGIERAKLVKCMAEVRGIQSAIIMDSDRGRHFMEPAAFWASHYHGKKPGPYYYLLDGDPNKGHGNDLDGIDEENPGRSSEKRDREDIKFVVLCQHDHGNLGHYVYCVDSEPPVVVGGEGGAEDPKYTRFIKYEYGGPGGGNDKDK